MVSKISVVINTLNNQGNIKRTLESAKWADEILVCDMHSDDKTVDIAKEMGAKINFHKKIDFVEPARNFAVSKASNDWILVLDPDEELPESLAKRLMQIASKMKRINYVKIPRKNIIFGKWMRASGWWPDQNIRFFKKGKVKWSDKIHIPPTTEGAGMELSLDEKYAIIHHHYSSISQFVERLNRYTTIQAKEIKEDGYNFHWSDLIHKPLGEFLSRFFSRKGYDDGIHGFALSLLQGFSQLIVYLKIWEFNKFENMEIHLNEVEEIAKKAGKEVDYWFKYENLSRNPFKRFAQKLTRKL